MDYFAGLFDAEGYISLATNGSYRIGMEMTNESAICLFRDRFGGHIDNRTRDNRRKTWTWRLNNDQVPYFLSAMSMHSIIKKPQIEALTKYLNQSREDRRKTRSDFVYILASLKKPHRGLLINPSHDFHKWLAGMMDGDGNFCVYECLNKGKWTQFQSYVGVFNVFIDPIEYINQKIPGTIGSLKKSINPVYKWTPFQPNIPIICQAVLPFLSIKKEQCKLVLAYHEMKKPDRFVQYTDEEKAFIRNIIKQIKHLNTL